MIKHIFASLTVACFMMLNASDQYVTFGFNKGSSSGGSVTLGQITASSHDSGNANAVSFKPILTPSGASGYTLSAFHSVSATSASGNINTNIYSNTTSGCSGSPSCAGVPLCTTSASTAGIVGDQVVNPTGCPTFNPNTLYWLAVGRNNAAYDDAGNLSNNCPVTDFGVGFSAATFPAMPNPAASSNFVTCYGTYAVFTCVGSCGVATPNYIVVDYAGGSNGATPTAATMNSSTHCAQGVWSIANSGALTNMTYVTTPLQAFVNSVVAPCNGTTYTGDGPGFALKRITGTNDQFPNDNLNYVWETGQALTQVSGGVWFETDTAQNVASASACDFWGMGNGATAIAVQFKGNGTNLFFNFEYSSPTATIAGPAFSTSTYYWVTTQFIPGTSTQSSMAIFNTSGTQVGSTVQLTNGNAGITTFIVGLGNQGSCFSSPVQNIWTGGIKLDPSGATFPLLANMFPDSPGVIGPVLADKVAKGEVARATMKDGKWYSNALGRFLE